MIKGSLKLHLRQSAGEIAESESRSEINLPHRGRNGIDRELKLSLQDAEPMAAITIGTKETANDNVVPMFLAPVAQAA